MTDDWKPDYDPKKEYPDIDWKRLLVALGLCVGILTAVVIFI